MGTVGKISKLASNSAANEIPCAPVALQVQFIARGPSGKGRVSADMYQDAAKKWQYYYLLVDVEGGRGRISIVDPHHHY